MNKPLVLIMAGGSGTRLWPLSLKKKPKQLLSIYSEKSLLQETIDRALTVTSFENIVIGTNDNLKKIIQQEIPQFTDKNFVIEPMGKNTTPIISLFAHLMINEEYPPETPLIVLSADHYVSPVLEWQQTIEKVLPFSNEYLWCLGVTPIRPDTGYGYIKVGPPLEKESLFQIEAFTEKPSAQTAQEYMNGKKHFWNSGMFVFSLGLFLSELEKLNPEIFILSKQCVTDSNWQAIFEKMPDISVDYAVLEKSNKMAVATANFTWDDVGSFLAFERVLRKDDSGNYSAVNVDTISIDSKNNVVSSSQKVALLGVKNLAIVENNGVLVVASLKQIDKIKDLRELRGEEYF